MGGGNGNAALFYYLDLNSTSCTAMFSDTYANALPSAFGGSALNDTTPLVIGDVAYFLGGSGGRATVVKYNLLTTGFGTFETTTIPNAINFATPANAINTGGEVIFLGSYTGGNTGTIKRFTFVLDDISGFTANYTPSTSTINLTWNDTPEESFYVIEKKVNSGEWESEATVDSNVVSHSVTGVDVVANKYSFRIRAGKLVVS
jgi:hypothetical protein